ncbi:Uncharacterised protein [Serratia fonticola]|uniref:Uncharacterized protein n=1 Tax=Serratia fonticola TaxID=47917 RepID=A0A4U9W459_SERFO|nr:Uncharacterised protein [Serratia fonticola]
MRITLAQFTCREGDIAHNLAAVLAQIERCSGQNRPVGVARNAAYRLYPS